MAELLGPTFLGPTAARERGFTLAEMLAALTILLFGVTALLGAMTSSVAQRRSTDAQLEAVALCEYALARVQETAVRRTDGALSDLELELAPLVDQAAPGFPGLYWSASTIVDQDRPDLWLVRIVVRWQESGDFSSVEFLRILPRQLSLGARVQRFREAPETTQTR